MLPLWGRGGLGAPWPGWLCGGGDALRSAAGCIAPFVCFYPVAIDVSFSDASRFLKSGLSLCGLFYLFICITEEVAQFQESKKNLTQICIACQIPQRNCLQV